jgi:hypothetical protein
MDVGYDGNAGRQTAPAFAAFSTSCTSVISEKVRMRGELKEFALFFILLTPTLSIRRGE